MGQLTICNVEVVSHSNKPTENHPLTLQSPLALQSFLASFNSLLWFHNCLGSLSSALFPTTAGSSAPAQHLTADRQS